MRLMKSWSSNLSESKFIGNVCMSCTFSLTSALLSFFKCLTASFTSLSNTNAPLTPMKCYLSTRERHMRTLGTLSPTIDSNSYLKYFSNSSFLFMASPHIRIKACLFLKVFDSKKFFLTTCTTDSSLCVSSLNFSSM